MPRGSGLSALLKAAKEQETDISGLSEFRLLTETEKRIILEHVHHPELSKSELADKTNIPRTLIYNFFASSRWETVNLEFARRQIKELVQLAIHTLRRSMLYGSPAIRLESATRVLISQKIIESRYRPAIVKEDNKIVVLLENDSLEPSVRADAKAALSNGDQNPILPASKAAGDTRLIGEI